MREILTGNWLLAELMPEEVDALQRVAQLQQIPTGRAIILQGKANDSLWIIAGGRFGIRVRGADGTEKIVAHLGPGDLAGEMSWLDGNSASASTVAVESSQAVQIKFADLDKFLWDRPDAHIQVLRKFAINLSHRLRAR